MYVLQMCQNGIISQLTQLQLRNEMNMMADEKQADSLFALSLARIGSRTRTQSKEEDLK